VTQGSACYTPPGAVQCLPITAETQIPLGSTVDATNGAVTITTTDGTFVFSLGAFVPNQLAGQAFRTTSAPGASTLTEVRLVGGDAIRCAVKLGAPSRLRTTSAKRKPVRRLFGKGQGNYRTRGSFASATVRGTAWLTEDYCDGTLVTVSEGVVDVRDFVLHKDVLVSAGHSYFAEKTARATQKGNKKKKKG
jgi:hypothetical protein